MSDWPAPSTDLENTLLPLISPCTELNSVITERNVRNKLITNVFTTICVRGTGMNRALEAVTARSKSIPRLASMISVS